MAQPKNWRWPVKAQHSKFFCSEQGFGSSFWRFIPWFGDTPPFVDPPCSFDCAKKKRSGCDLRRILRLFRSCKVALTFFDLRTKGKVGPGPWSAKRRGEPAFMWWCGWDEQSSGMESRTNEARSEGRTERQPEGCTSWSTALGTVPFGFVVLKFGPRLFRNGLIWAGTSPNSLVNSHQTLPCRS